MQLQGVAINDSKKRQRRQDEEHARVLRFLPSDMQDNRVILKKQICALGNLGDDTLDKLWAAGDGPGPRIRVTARRVGVRYCDFIAWLESPRLERWAE